jgi:hypothetical protein
MNLYLNGDLMAVGSTTNDSTLGTVEQTRLFTIGAVDDGSNGHYTGLIGHSRVAETVRSADWIKTEHNNQSSPSTFYSLSGENFFNNTIFFGCNF